MILFFAPKAHFRCFGFRPVVLLFIHIPHLLLWDWACHKVRGQTAGFWEALNTGNIQNLLGTPLALNQVCEATLFLLWVSLYSFPKSQKNVDFPNVTKFAIDRLESQWRNRTRSFTISWRFVLRWMKFVRQSLFCCCSISGGVSLKAQYESSRNNSSENSVSFRIIGLFLGDCSNPLCFTFKWNYRNAEMYKTWHFKIVFW